MESHSSRRSVLAGGAVAVVSSLAGCIVTGSTEEESIDETYDVDDVSALAVRTRNGDLTVSSADRASVAVSGTKRAASEDDLESIDLEVTRADGVLDLAADRDSRSFLLRLGSSRRIDLEITVPEGFPVEHVETRNGSVDVTNVVSVGADGGDGESDEAGWTSVRSRNGEVDVTDVEGDLSVETRNGGVTVATVTGDVTAETRNGEVDVTDVAGDLSVETRNGSVTARFSDPLEATLELSTRNGQLTVDGTADGQRITSDSSLETTVGDGGRRIEIETRNGSVDVRGESDAAE